MELNNKSTKNNIYVSIYLSVLNFQVRTPVPLHREKKEDMFKIKTGASTMLSLAAIAAWAFIENITYQRHLFGTKKDVYNGSSILQYKRGRSSSSFPFKKANKGRKKKKRQHSVQRHSRERRLPSAVLAAQSYCSMLLIVLLVDSSFKCLVVYLQAREREKKQMCTSVEEQRVKILKYYEQNMLELSK